MEAARPVTRQSPKRRPGGAGDTRAAALPQVARGRRADKDRAAAAAPPATYLHVADDGLEEASERAAFLLDHSLHFPGAGGDGTRALRRLDCARDPAGSPREEFPTRSLSSKEDRVPEGDCSLPKITTIISKAKPLRRVICLHAALSSRP